MHEPTFDIFRGTTDKDAVWVEAVDGLFFAQARMKEIAAAAPGSYFVFESRNRAILARIDTRTSLKAKVRGAA